MADMFDEAKVVKLGEGVHAIELQQGEFDHFDGGSSVLFVRNCTRVIYDALNDLRMKNDASENKAAFLGQPGIGKSYSLYYFLYRFLQEDGVDVVVLQNFETMMFQVFACEGATIDVKLDVSSSPTTYQINDHNSSIVFTLLEKLSERAVLLVDMKKGKEPIRRRKGLTVYSSSHGPYTEQFSSLRNKASMPIFSPPPLGRKETEVIYNHLDWKCKQQGMNFDEYFDVFGGTIRPMNLPEQDFESMNEGTKKILSTPVQNIINTMEKGPKAASEDFTDAIFSEQGGSEEERYKESPTDPPRKFRSDFSEFWFRQYVAPRILFQHYTSEVASILYYANEGVNGGTGGCNFKELFHKLLPLGNWTVKKLPGIVEPPTNAFDWIRHLLGWYGTSEEKDDSITERLDLIGAPVIQRVEQDMDEVKLSAEWNKFTMAKEGTNIGIRRDVANLIATCQKEERFYWIPRRSLRKFRFFVRVFYQSQN